MARHLHLAQMCAEVYTGKLGYIPGWERRDYIQDQDGLGIAIYENSELNEMVIVFRGTDITNLTNFIRNLYTNMEIARGNLPKTLSSAFNTIQKTRKDRTIFTRIYDLIFSGKFNQLILAGHSLGAVLAQLAGIECLKQGKRYKVFAFEGPGFAHLVPTEILERYAKEIKEDFLSYFTSPNFINTFYPSVGMIRQIHFNPRSDILKQASFYKSHAINCITDDLLRLYLWANILYPLFSNYMSEEFSAILLNVTQYTLSLLGVSSLNLYGPITTLLVVILLMKFYFYLTQTIARTLEHHPIDVLSKQFNNPDGLPTKYSEVERWPNRYEFFSHLLIKSLTWPLPFTKSHPNMLTLLSPRKFEEEDQNNIPGYKVGCIIRNSFS